MYWTVRFQIRRQAEPHGHELRDNRRGWLDLWGLGVSRELLRSVFVAWNGGCARPQLKGLFYFNNIIIKKYSLISVALGRILRCWGSCWMWDDRFVAYRGCHIFHGNRSFPISLDTWQFLMRACVHVWGWRQCVLDFFMLCVVSSFHLAVLFRCLLPHALPWPKKEPDGDILGRIHKW